MTRTRTPRYTLEIEAPANGRIRKATVTVRNDEREVKAADKGDLHSDKEREQIAKRLAKKLGDVDAATLRELLDEKWFGLLNEQERLRRQVAAGSTEAVGVEHVELLDSSPAAIRRPLCLVNGQAFAAAWVPMQRSVSRSVQAERVVNHDPPLVSVEDVLLIVTGDGTLYADASAPNARTFAELGLLVRLPAAPPPERGWSGAGVKRYLAGERPDPAVVFGQMVSVVDRFIDFSRSLATQQTMCELTACHILATYFLDAFNVVGYFWPNGEKGCGKTTFLQVVAELGYLGQLILAGSSYACLRDMADYGATLAFDDAEAVMDTRRTDPDKRTLLLAGNRRGATIAVKELEPDGKRWTTRHVNTFCSRLFSAIRLPDDTLGSRTIIIPLVRSGDERRAKSNPLDPKDWPCDRRQLVDDLWALGLANLHELSEQDRQAATGASLSGRNLDPWRPILAVALWLQERHGVAELFERMEALSVNYQKNERSEYEEGDSTRVLFRALLELNTNPEADGTVQIQPKAVSEAMNLIANAEHLAEPDKPFTTPRKVGWLLKRQRFKRPRDRSEKGKLWETTRQEIETAARAYGIDTTADATEGTVPF